MTTLHLTSNLIDIDTRLGWDYTAEEYTVKDLDLLTLWLQEADFQQHGVKAANHPHRYIYDLNDDVLYISLYTLLDSSVDDFNATEAISVFNKFVKVLKKMRFIKKV